MIALYQPVFGRTDFKTQRDCWDRWAAMELELPKRPYSFLDIGSQVGFYIMSAAQHGAIAVGVERVTAYVKMAHAIQTRRKIERATFLNLEINEQTMQMLPRFEVTCCLSVFHHWAMEWGFAKADKIFTELCRNTSLMFFETGQSNEPVKAFGDRLQFMGADPQGWLRNYLRDKGFTEVRALGEYQTNLSPIRRTMYMGRK